LGADPDSEVIRGLLGHSRLDGVLPKILLIARSLE